MNYQPYTVAQIDQQTQVFKDAYAAGKISFQEYRYAMSVQTKNRAEAVEREKPSTYWNPPTPETVKQPIVNPATSVQIVATPGYRVVEGSIREEPTEQPFIPGQLPSVITYQEAPIPEPVKQSDLSIASQLNIGFDLGLKVLNQLAEKETNPIIRELIKTETNFPIAAGLGFVSGGGATLEGTAYFTASIPGSIKKSAESGKLQYAPGVEGFGMKNPQLAPTTLGAGINAVLGNRQELEEINKMPGFYGAGYVIGSGLADLGLSMTEGAAISKAVNLVRGAKVTSLVGAKEIESLTGTGKSLSRTSITEPMLSSTRISQSAAKKLQEFNRFVTSDRVLLGGSKSQVELYADKTYRFVSTGVNKSMDAQILIPTINRSLTSRPNLIGQIGYRLGRGSKTANLVSYSEKKLADQYGSFATKSAGLLQKNKPFVFQKEIATNIQEIYPFGKAYSKKIYSSVLIEGKVDSSIYLNYVKNVGPAISQKWYREMGGLGPQLLQRATAKGTISTVKVYSNIVGISISKTSMGKGAIVASIPLGFRDTKTSNRQTGKRTSRSITQTNPILAVIPAPSSKTRQQPRDIHYQPVFFGETQQGKQSQFINLVPSIATNDKQRDNVSNNIFYDLGQRTKPIITPSFIQHQDIRQQPQPRQRDFTSFNPNPRFDKTRVNFNPFFKVGGGSGGGGGSSSLRGRWWKKNNPLKTSAQMLKTFGITPTKSSKKHQGKNNVNPILGFNSKNPILSINSKKKKRKR